MNKQKMEIYFEEDGKLKLKYSKQYAKHMTGYRIVKFIGDTFWLLSVSVVVGMLSLSIWSYFKYRDDFLAYLLMINGMGIIFASIPFFIGQSIRWKALMAYAKPFGERDRCVLGIFDDCIQFNYIPCRPFEKYVNDSRYTKYRIKGHNNSLDVFSIDNNQLRGVLYNPNTNVLTLVGKCDFKRILNIYTGKEYYDKPTTYEHSTFEILLSFEERDEILDLLQKRAECIGNVVVDYNVDALHAGLNVYNK